MKIRAVKGFNDILPSDSPKWQFIERTLREVFALYAYSEIRVPIVEKTEVFSRSIGEATDIVEKEMYTFLDKKGTSLTLRPEGTASVVRAFVQNALYSKNPINKLYYMGPMFRYERPQKGRYRQFYQVGAEFFGEAAPYADAEMLAMIMHFFDKIGLDEVVLNINSLGCDGCRKEYKKALVTYFKAELDKLCENCTRRIDLNPLRILDCKAASCNELKEDAPLLSKYLCGDCADHFSKVKSSLDALNVPYILNERMVRGLDYYTRTTFEVTTNLLGAQNAVAAGGRYDKLCEQFSGPKTPAIGFALGVERLSLLLGDEKDYKEKPAIFIAAIGDKAKKVGFKILDSLRQNNITCEMELADKSLKSQMRRADKSGCKHVLIIGEDELTNNAAVLRDMSTKDQRDVNLESVSETIIAQCNS
ncbi:histidine--tRNA ligase [Thermodesulfobacteriota bacterium]